MDLAARRLGGYLALGGLMAVLDTTVTTVAVPGLIADFSADVATTTWMTTAYALALVAVMPTAAWAMGRLGARLTYLLALTLFTAGSLATGMAWNIDALIAFRVVQGLGGGLLNPVGMAIALTAVPPGRRGQMMSLLGLPVLIGPLIGPILGGALIDSASWRWIFWINVPLGVLAVLIGRRLLRPQPRPTDVHRLDVPGLLLLSPGLTLAVLGLSLAGDHGRFTSVPVLLPIVGGAGMIAVFTRRAWRSPHPLLRIRVLQQPATAASAATVALFTAAYFGSAVIGPAYVQLVRGDSATISGAIGIPQALATGLAFQVATRLIDRIPPRTVIGIGIAVAVLGTVARVLVLTPTTSYSLIAALGAVTGLGIGATLMPTMTAGTRNLEGEDLPAGTAVLNVIAQTAVATGTALTAAILTWLTGVYAPHLLGGLAATAHLPAANRTAYATPLADATRVTLGATTALMAAAWLTNRRQPRHNVTSSIASDRPLTHHPNAQQPPAALQPGRRRQPHDGSR